MDEISLIIEEKTFKVKKNLLCEFSDYFRAMFSGNYMENKQNEITIDVIDSNSMTLIVNYMENGLIDLFEYPLSTLGDLAMAANFLQITELIKQIQYTLECLISISNWIEIMTIAENASYTKLEQYCAGYGLLSFKSMKPEHVPSIHKLYWYLSHAYLDAGTEFNVFQFGFQWISHSETGADALMIILACLDVKRLTMNDLVEIKKLIKDYDISLAAKVVDFLLELFMGNIELTDTEITKHKNMLCEKCTERVYIEVLHLVQESRGRIFCYVPVIPIWKVKDDKAEVTPHYMYTFTQDKGFEEWLEVGEKDLWGWNVAAWGPMRLVVACGERGRGTGVFMRDIKVYDTLRKEWIQHGVQLPPRRHGGLAIVDDTLFIVGGVGGFRVTLDAVLVYDLKQRTYRNIARLPDAIQNPAVCAHEGKVYAAGHNNIYRYDDHGDRDEWVRVVGTDIRMSCLMSYNGYIYCTQNYFSYLYRFDPINNKKLDMITSFTNPPAAVCNLGDKLVFFTRSMCGGQIEVFSVEVYEGKTCDKKPNVVWSKGSSNMKINDVAGSCSLIMSAPPVKLEESQYHSKYLMRYIDQ